MRNHPGFEAPWRSYMSRGASVRCRSGTPLSGNVLDCGAIVARHVNGKALEGRGKFCRLVSPRAEVQSRWMVKGLDYVTCAIIP